MEFEDYVAARGQPLVRFAYALTLDAHLAEDLVQTALADLYRHWWRVSRADHPDAYVRRAVVNAYLTWRRRRSSAEVPVDVQPSSFSQVDDVASGVVDRDLSRRMLVGLAPRARTVLVLRYYMDMDDAAIADAMGTSVSAVRSTASRALATLRERLATVTKMEEQP